jgi:hypothetical protein
MPKELRAPTTMLETTNSAISDPNLSVQVPPASYGFSKPSILSASWLPG